MRNIARLIATTGLLVLPAAGLAMGNGGHGKPPTVTCPTDGNVVAALEAACPCEGTPGDTGPVAWRNHGQYVRCVVHYRNALRKAGCFTDDSVRRSVARCAARSTCGKTGTVLCCHYESGTCSDPNPADQVATGTCSNGGAACNVNADCTQSTARLAHDDAACTADGGVVVLGGGSVCQQCPPPPPPAS